MFYIILSLGKTVGDSHGCPIYLNRAYFIYFFNVNQIMKDFPRRKPTRLQNFNYSEYRVYYVTICTKDRNHFFGGIIDKKMKLSKIGKVAEKCWLEIPDHFLEIELMDFVIMPDHLHGILKIQRSNKYSLSEKKSATSHSTPPHN